MVEQPVGQREGQSPLRHLGPRNVTGPLYDIGDVTSSNTNHMVVDGIGIYGAHSKNMAPSGDNTGNLIGGALPSSFGSNPMVRMSTATRTSVGDVNMNWAWAMNIVGHGHGSYDQTGGHALVATTASDNTVTGPSGTWATNDVGGTITIMGAGVAGADYTTTIAAFTSSSSIEVTLAPATSVGSTEATWGFASIMKDNITFEEVHEPTQTYGSAAPLRRASRDPDNIWVAAEPSSEASLVSE